MPERTGDGETRTRRRGQTSRSIAPPGTLENALIGSTGASMLDVPLTPTGPDLAAVERLATADASIKGMWCVPRYSNPTGTVYGAEVVRGLAALKAAAPDFRLFWDDAYRLHHLTDRRNPVADVLAACAGAGHPDRAIVFASTSKVTFAGAGLAALASSAANVAWWQKHVTARSIGPDKLNQLRHVRFLKDRAHVEALMDRPRALLKPKFDLVEQQFSTLLDGVDGVSWTHPEGGYFIDLVTPAGCARKTVDLAKRIGITLTPAGASFPYGKDPRDQHIRIAPTFPSRDELEIAARGVALSLKLSIGC